MRLTLISFLTFIVFLILKLTGAIDWSWGFVLMPIAWFVGAVSRETEIERALGKNINVDI